MSYVENQTRPSIISIMSEEDINFLFAKIFHDLVSPINTISLGLDSLESIQDSSILRCVKESAKNVTSLIELFRFCISNLPTQCSKSELEKILRNIRTNLKITANNETIDIHIAQLICLTMFSLDKIIAKNETIICDINTKEDQYIFYIKLGKNILAMPDLKLIETSARNILWNLALKYTDICDLKLWIEKNDDLTTFLVCSKK